FQMMDRLHASIAKHDLSLIHNEDPVASAAVSTLISGLTNSPNVGAARVAWTILARDISSMHTAADAEEREACATLLKRVDDEFRNLQKDAEPTLLQAAHQYAERLTCPMHPDVIGVKGDICWKCGMPLDQPV